MKTNETVCHRKKNTDGHQKTRYEKNIKCSDNTLLPPEEIDTTIINKQISPSELTNKVQTKTKYRAIDIDESMHSALV